MSNSIHKGTSSTQKSIWFVCIMTFWSIQYLILVILLDHTTCLSHAYSKCSEHPSGLFAKTLISYNPNIHNSIGPL